MAIKPAGTPLTMQEIAAEFGGSVPHSLSEYYRGGGLVPNGPAANAGIATSGAISMQAFYGAVKAFVFTDNITSDLTNYNLRTRAIAAGWDQVLPLDARITVAGGVVISANSTGVYAFDTGTTAYPAGSRLSVDSNNANVLGMGGAGGAGRDITHGTSSGGSGGGGGGPAVRVNLPTTWNNSGGTIGGGGGGGGGGNANFGTVGSGKNAVAYQAAGGGGGAGRSGRTNSAGGRGGIAQGVNATNGSPGGGGALAYAGGGGAGGSGPYPGGTGGIGGNWGASGGSGVMGAGGGGAAVVGNSNITWTNTGTRLGAIS